MRVLLFLLASAAAAQTVEGVVINTATGRGIPGARIDLRPAGQRAGQPLYIATSDPDGHFRIDDVKEGSYTPRYTAAHFSPADGVPTGRDFHVTTASSPVRIEGRLAPNTHITGRVLDGRGDPVPKARVDLTLPQAFWTAPTDSDGRFDFDTAVAGPSDYRISASAPSGWKPPDPDPDTHRPRAWARTFYPAVLRREEAAPLALSPGIDLRDLEIRLLAVPVHAVRGVLLLPDGTPAKLPAALVEPGPRPDASYKIESQPDGAFEFPAVPEGVWRLVSLRAELRLDEWLDLSGRDRDLGKLRLAPPFTLRGRVIVDLPQGAAPPKLSEILLIPQHDRQIVFSGLPIRDTVPYPDRTFRFENVYPGDYLILPGEPPPLFYVDSVRLGENPVEHDVALSDASPEITIVYKTNGGTVSGTVENCSGGKVLLRAAQTGPAWQSRSVPCDGAGRFEIAGLKPGEYAALALSANRPIESTTPLLPSAARVTVRAGEITRVNLKLSGLR